MLSQSRIFSGLRSVCIRFKSCRTGLKLAKHECEGRACRWNPLTGNAGKKLAGETLNLAVRERNKAVGLQKVKDALSQQIHHYADMAPKVEAVAQVNTPVSVLFVVGLQSCEHPEFYSRGIAVFLHGTNNLDGNWPVSTTIPGLHNLAKSTLAQKL